MSANREDLESVCAHLELRALGGDVGDAGIGDVEAVAVVEPGERQLRLGQREECAVRQELAALDVQMRQL